MLWHMHLMGNIQHLADRDGIICVRLQDAVATAFRFNAAPKIPKFDGNDLRRGGGDLEATAEQCAKLFAAAGEPELLRVVFADYSIIVEKHGTTTVVVVMISGHSVAKSVHRLIRRLDKSAKKAPAAVLAEASPTA